MMNAFLLAAGNWRLADCTRLNDERISTGGWLLAAGYLQAVRG